MLPLVFLITFVGAVLAVWTLLHTTNYIFTLVALGGVIVCGLLGFSFAPLPVRLLIVFALYSVEKLQFSSNN